MSLRGIYIINLDRRPDRLDSVVNQLKKSDLKGVPVTRISAFDSSKQQFDFLLTKQALEELKRLEVSKLRDFHAQLSKGAVGCYISHFNTWKKIAESDAADSDVFLILEDDATVPENGLQKIKKGLETFDEEERDGSKPYLLLWEVICLRDCRRTPNNLFKPGTFFSTQAYSINGKSAREMVKLPLFPIENQIDAELQIIRDEGLLDIYAYPSFKNNSVDTDIQVRTRRNAPIRRPKDGDYKNRYSALSLADSSESSTYIQPRIPPPQVTPILVSVHQPVVTKCDSNKTAIVVCGVIGSVIVVILIIVLSLLLYRRHKSYK